MTVLSFTHAQTLRGLIANIRPEARDQPPYLLQVIKEELIQVLAEAEIEEERV